MPTRQEAARRHALPATPAGATSAQPAEIPAALTRRVMIERLEPEIDGGRFPIKRTIGESVDVSASIFADGHDVLVAVLRDRPVGSAAAGRDADWRETPMVMVAPGTDRWTARFDVASIGWHEYHIVARIDPFLTWRREVRLKAAAGQDISLDLQEASLLIRDAAKRATSEHASLLVERADALSDSSQPADRLQVALGDDLAAAMAACGDRLGVTESPVRRVWVDRVRARFGAWYEMFPRSAGRDSGRSGTFADASAWLPRIADLGFDIVYLPPIHPIGTSFRKGRNNALRAGPADPGSPWAIGSPDGGHTAVEPGLGTLEDFAAFREAAAALDLEIALDLAWQCSPDHPWVREHPEWFRHRSDGTIKYAENPPKKYQDIYPFDFSCAEWRSLWQALLEVTLFWLERGVRIFRVDNPHTKTFGFWEWMIEQVHARDASVIFLSEAFTRPAPMRYLAKAGFTQSYTYFTWRNTKAELVEYFTELTATEVAEYLRPNLFTNTPDILHAYLQQGGRPAFEARLLLASTLGASYGIYSGFELAEGQAVPGTEEYADSEKYQFRQWDWDRPGHINALIARMNRIRREHRALQFDRTLRFHATDNAEIIAYSKAAPDGTETLLTIVNLDPHHMQQGHVEIAGIGADTTFTVRDLIDEVVYEWRGPRNYVRFDPGIRQGHVLELSPAAASGT